MMHQWSDGTERDYSTTDLQCAISDYFGEPRADEIRRLLVENEALRDEIAAQSVLAKGATA